MTRRERSRAFACGSRARRKGKALTLGRERGDDGARTSAAPEAEEALLVRIGVEVGALSLAHVIEVMRPLPVQPIGGAPPCILGAAVVRGVAVPVVDAAALLASQLARRVGRSEVASDRRFVSVRAGSRRAALVVDAVVGVVRTALSGRPSLLVAAELDAMDDGLAALARAVRAAPEELAGRAADVVGGAVG